MRDNIASLLENARQEFCFSGYQLSLYQAGNEWDLAHGVTSHWPNAMAVGSGTKFDIGSITKTLVTTSLLARAIDRHEMRLDETLGRKIPELKNSGYAKLTLGDLLSHTGGIIAWYPLYREKKLTSLTEWFLTNEKKLIVESPGKKAIYSDFGFLLLGLVIEKHWGSLESAFEAEVLSPLRLEGVGYGPLGAKDDVVATEYCLYRKKVLQGDVFDENAWALGGKAAHAGVFASAKSLIPWAREWLNAREGRSSWLTKETAALFTHASDRVKGSSWAFGWDMKSERGSTAGDVFSLESFGSLGYTGCSIWIDPKVSGIAIFFTNRVHPSRHDERIRAIRPALHDMIAGLWRAPK